MSKNKIILDDNCTLNQALNEFKNKQYIIPKFQRDYWWGTEMVKELIKSVLEEKFINIITLYKANKTNWEIDYFWYSDLEFAQLEILDEEGNPLFNRGKNNLTLLNMGSTTLYGVLDWQQRLTTLMNAFCYWTYYENISTTSNYVKKYISLNIPFESLKSYLEYRKYKTEIFEFDLNWIDIVEIPKPLKFNLDEELLEIPLELLWNRSDIKDNLLNIESKIKETEFEFHVIENILLNLSNDIEKFKIYRAIYESYNQIEDLYEIFIKINTFWKSLTDIDIINSLVDSVFEKESSSENYLNFIKKFTTKKCIESWNKNEKSKDYISFYLKWILGTDENKLEKQKLLQSIFRRVVYWNIADIELKAYLTDSRFKIYYLNFIKSLNEFKQGELTEGDCKKLDFELDEWFFDENGKLNTKKEILIKNFESFFTNINEKEFWAFYFKNAFPLFFNFTKYLESNFPLLRAEYIDSVPQYVLYYIYSYLVYQKHLSSNLLDNWEINNAFNIFIKNFLIDSHFYKEKEASFIAGTVRIIYNYFQSEYNKIWDISNYVEIINFLENFRLKNINSNPSEKNGEKIKFKQLNEQNVLRDLIGKKIDKQNIVLVMNSFFWKKLKERVFENYYEVDHIFPVALCEELKIEKKLYNSLGNKWLLEKQDNRDKLDKFFYADKELLKIKISDFDLETIEEDYYNLCHEILTIDNKIDIKFEKKDKKIKIKSWKFKNNNFNNLDKDCLKYKIISFIEKRENKIFKNLMNF